MGDAVIIEESLPSARSGGTTVVEATEVVRVVSRPRAYEATKRVIDVLVALIGIIIALPLCAVIAVLIKLNSAGPVLFRQKRPGKDGVPFEVLKFRTMVKDAEERLDEVHDVNDTEDPLIRVEDDPRVTGVGHLLRVTSLDELPQLVNVLKGEMSLVGPRPISRPIHDPRNRLRLQVTPGITGLWQVSGRKSRDTNFMLEKDMEYLRRRSLGFDLLLLLRTFAAVIKADGAR
jgi:lipopolysaccharide/colanic/teichoic acid biosynthesis glycosyltransferase